jgi:tetratricopeptide (TPR) repeat protein
MKATNLLACVVLVVFAQDASAGPKQTAKKHLGKATKAHADGKFQIALKELQKAYKLDPQPDLLYAIGQVYAKLGNCKQAKVHYNKFLAKSADPAVKPAVREAIASCKPARAAEPVEPTPPPVEPTPPPVEPTPPPAEPPPPPVEPPPPPTVVPPPAAGGRVATGASTQIVERPDSPWYKDVVGDALVVGGAAAVIGGVVVYRGAVSDLDAAESSDDLNGYQELIDQAQSRRTISIVLVGGGAALVTAGVLRYILRDSGSERGVAIAPTTSGGLVTWGGQF